MLGEWCKDYEGFFKDELTKRLMNIGSFEHPEKGRRRILMSFEIDQDHRMGLGGHSFRVLSKPFSADRVLEMGGCIAD